MTLVRWPAPQELGNRYEDWLRLAWVYAIVADQCSHLDWFEDLEAMVMRMATEVDGILDMTEFVQIFYNALAYADFELYRIVRDCLLMPMPY